MYIVSSTTQHGESWYSPFTKNLRPTLTCSAAAHWNVLVYIDQFSQGYSWTLSCFSFDPFFSLSTLYCYNQNREQERGEDEWLLIAFLRVWEWVGGGDVHMQTHSQCNHFIRPLSSSSSFFLVRFLLTFYAINRSLESHQKRGNHHGERLWRAHHPLRLNPTSSKWEETHGESRRHPRRLHRELISLPEKFLKI